MKEILLKHMECYPHMQVADAVKLLYQSEFGGGHMIASPAKSLEWIRAEWEQMKPMGEASGTGQEACTAPAADVVRIGGTARTAGVVRAAGTAPAAPVLEEIGGGICRISLRALDEGLSPETLNRIFVKTADQTAGTTEAFEKKLDILKELCAEGRTPFSIEELERYLTAYREEGYPPVSHSETYREHYHPCYRVAAVGYTRYYKVFLEIDRALAAAGDRQVLVAIEGMCGSGKSTLGRILEEIYDCNLFHMDDFFLRPEQRSPKRLAEAGGNVDYERFKAEVLDHIADPAGISCQIYDCRKQKLDGFVKVPCKRLNIVEGAYSLHPYFGKPYDLRFFCKISSEEQLGRIMKRNGPEMLERFKNTWIPMENRYFEAFETEKDCIVIE